MPSHHAPHIVETTDIRGAHWPAHCASESVISATAVDRSRITSAVELAAPLGTAPTLLITVSAARP
jgi:hypothetical protein